MYVISDAKLIRITDDGGFLCDKARPNNRLYRGEAVRA